MKTMRTLSILFFSIISSIAALAQRPEVIQQYVDTYKDLAIEEMRRTGVPASITLAQGIHETSAGTSDLVVKSNNHFGIKCKSNWNGPSVSHDDDARGECFRKYEAAIESYRDHSNFLKTGPRYASLFNLDPQDYSSWAYGLKKAGYATNPKYPTVLIRLIEDYHLQDYTLIAMGKMIREDVVTVADVHSEVTPVNETVAAPPLPQAPIYPEGQFTINDTKVVFVKQGVPFLAVAKQYDISLSRIFDFNDLPKSETSDADQLIFLQRKRKTGNAETHTVQPGETIQDIAQTEAIRLESLMEYNYLKNGQQPAIGEILNLKGKANAAPRLVLKDNFTLAPNTKSWSQH
jgi:hypothetical protein